MRGTDTNFPMGQDYPERSRSQQTIGATVIEKAVQMVSELVEGGRSNTVRALDIACGPGNLTLVLHAALLKVLGDTRLELVGVDKTPESIDRLVADSKGKICGLVGSFFDEKLLPPAQTLIFSNEGLHWQPPREMDAIIYSLLGDAEKKAYCDLALESFTTALRNIYNALSDGGVAVLQFGHEGQLANLWNLVDEVLNESEFSQYKAGINFPLFYPTLEQVADSLRAAGFAGDKTTIEPFMQDLTEDSAAEITAFFRAFSEPAFSQIMSNRSVLGAFYQRIEQRLGEINLDKFRKVWHRTLITVSK